MGGAVCAKVCNLWFCGEGGACSAVLKFVTHSCVAWVEQCCAEVGGAVLCSSGWSSAVLKFVAQSDQMQHVLTSLLNVWNIRNISKTLIDIKERRMYQTKISKYVYLITIVST